MKDKNKVVGWIIKEMPVKSKRRVGLKSINFELTSFLNDILKNFFK